MAPPAKWTLEPVEKLSLAVRKHGTQLYCLYSPRGSDILPVRDNFETNKAEYQEKIANYMGVEEFTINVNVNQVFAYTETSNYGKDNIGYLINEYFNTLVRKIGEYTKDGKDEEAKEVLRKVVPKRSASLQADDKVSYCGLRVADGEFQVIFNYKNLGSNISNGCDKIDEAVDVALDALGENELPVVARRAIQEHLDTAIPELEEKMQKMFGKEYKFEYDVRATLDKLLQFPNEISWFKDRINSTVPDFIARYFKAVVRNLEEAKFGSDDMLQEAFVESTEKQIVRFEVVDKLQNGKSYNDTLFVDGEYRVQTMPKSFGSNLDDTGRDVVDRL
ncbi:hypothetical protein EXIGLDRAFT_274983 [Exidia glandulosa HHB12029]|uniref:Uncharacterized protein n=1 Tax=Exidia glandulosa HHB12029 TaxID=1314781 RepID=A0A165M805_EXIGL|nr:hypothetical protein EXIGLDRAFT_274983 [Exidia glandulosa HHB12029]